MNTDIVDPVVTIPFGALTPGDAYESNCSIMIKSNAKFSAKVRSTEVMTWVEDYNCFCAKSGRPGYMSDECEVIYLECLGFKKGER